ncbi:MAG: phage regulatory CII family protein, partial [Aeromonas sp.]
TLSEAIAATELTDNDCIIHAWARSRGHVLVRMPEGTTCEEELTDQVLMVAEVVGEAFAELRKAREDGVIDPIERQAFTALVHKAVREMLNLEEAVASQVRTLPRVRGEK